MRARTATVGDLETVFHDLSQRMSQEYRAAGVGAQAAHDDLTMNLKEGRAHVLLQDNGEPAAIIAWNEHDDVAHTMFAAQESFFSAATVRFCKQHIRRIQALAGNLPIQHRSWIDHPDAARWFRVIGFVEKGKSNGSTLFELPPE